MRPASPRRGWNGAFGGGGASSRQDSWEGQGGVGGSLINLKPS
jgi:hypothetical protein